MGDSDNAKGAADTHPAATGGKSRRRLVIAGIALAVLAIAGTAVAVIINRDDTPFYDTAQIGWMHEGCQQWAESYRGGDAPDGTSCTAMTDWMTDRMGANASGRTGMMMGPAMWQDPASMRATCEQWMATDPSGVPDAMSTETRCGQMVDWMDQNMGGWNDWMTSGPMMDNP